MKFLVLSVYLSLMSMVSSCSLFKMSAAHDKMAVNLETMPYNFNLKELQSRLVTHLEYTGFDNKMIAVSSSTAAGDVARQQAVKEAMDEGFIYKDMLYTSTLNIDFSFITTDLVKIKDKVLKGKFHTLENNEDSFLIVKGDKIYEGIRKEKDSNTCLLKVYRLTSYYRPLNYGFDWLNLLMGKGMAFGITSGPIDLMGSRKYQQRDKIEELAVFFRIDKDRADKMESDILSTI